MGSMVMGQTLVRAYPFSQLYALKPFKTLQTRSHEAHQQQQQQRNYHQVHGQNWFLQAKYNYGGFKLIRIIQSKPPDQQAKEAPKEYIVAWRRRSRRTIQELEEEFPDILLIEESGMTLITAEDLDDAAVKAVQAALF